MERVGAENGDHEGIVSIGRDIEGVEVSIFLRETDNGCKASLRSNEYVNGLVPPIADNVATTASAFTLALPSCNPSVGVIVNPVISGFIMLTFFL